LCQTFQRSIDEELLPHLDLDNEVRDEISAPASDDGGTEQLRIQTDIAGD
jgi:hypothetical protein